MNLIPFSFEQHPVRVVMREGEPWFASSDVCEALTVGNNRDAIGRLDDDEKGVGTVDTPGGRQDLGIINESGLYSLILTSRKPEAKRFKKWVTAEVLPSIRKTGGYVYSVPQTLPEALRLAADLAEQRNEAQAKLAIAKPKAAALDRIATHAEGSLCITDAAKALQLTPKHVFKWMEAHHWIYRRLGKSGWIAYQDRIQSGLLEHKVTTVQGGDGVERVYEQVLVTAKGLAKLSEVFSAAK